MARFDTEYLLSVHRAAEAAGHGGKSAVYAEACRTLGIGRAALHRHLNEACNRARRKRRADKGAHTLPFEEALIISAYLMEGYRKNRKKTVSLKEAVRTLRANGKILAGRVDPETGEFFPLSDSAIHKTLYAYCLHPKQLRQPPPHIHMRAKHPNHVWQIDASVCTLYYLPTGEALIETDQAVHYKNRPENLAAISRQRVIRYVVTDHASGVIRWRYYPHSESGENTVRFLAWAMLPKDKLTRDPFYGVPFIVQVDPGATSAGLVQRFCERLTIELLVNLPGAPRSKGQVENAQNIVETYFEQGLRFCGKRIRSIEELNALADTVQVYFNATENHSRHGRARLDEWMTIRQEELRVLPEGINLLALATTKPETRVISDDLTIEFLGRRWKVAEVPSAIVGGQVDVCENPLQGGVFAVIFGEDGRETLKQLPEVRRVEHGYYEDATVIGEKFISHKDTPADRNRKLVAQIAAGVEGIEAATKKRRRKDYEPFDGTIEPFKRAKETVLPDRLSRRGEAQDMPRSLAPEVDALPLGHRAAARRLIELLGDAWRPEYMQEIQTRYPAGVPEADLEALAAEFRERGETPAKRPPLKGVK
jgi:hypothetical protein